MNGKSSAMLVAIAVIICASGCTTVSLTQVRQFGAASSVLGESASEAFNLADKASVDRNLYSVASNPGEGPIDSTFQGLFNGDSIDPEGRVKAERLRVRIELLASLTSYANALQRLAEEDVNADIDKASKDLLGSLSSLQRSYGQATGGAAMLTDEDLGMIATAVNAVGKGVAEIKRRQAIKSIILRTDPGVQRATSLVADDLGRESELAAYVSAAVSNTRGSIQQAYNLQRDKVGFDARLDMLRRAAELYKLESEVPDFFEAVSDGAEQVGTTHAELARVVRDNTFSSEKLGRMIGDLEKYARSVQNFSQSLKDAK